MVPADEVLKFTSSVVRHQILRLKVLEPSLYVSCLSFFLAKNQVPSPIVTLPALTFIPGRDVEDRLLARFVLAFYLRRFRPLRKTAQGWLFISYNPDFSGDISLQSISRWLTLVIQQAYQSSALPSSTHVHEVRAWSASLAFQHSVPLSAILEAA